MTALVVRDSLKDNPNAPPRLFRPQLSNSAISFRTRSSAFSMRPSNMSLGTLL